MQYKQASLPVAKRVEDLLARLSTRQKIDQITCLVTISEGVPDFSKLIPYGIGNIGAFTDTDRLEEVADYVEAAQRYLVEDTEFGIPALIHCEAVSGVQTTHADVFPSPISQASTWNPNIVKRMADSIRRQMLALGLRQALSPVFDISRDPRWGRLTETYGEDPALAAAMGTAFVSGIQGNDLSKGIAATGKHFVGHGVTEGALNMSRTILSPRELEEVHAKPFQAAITEAGLKSVMSSYCSYNGEAATASRLLLTELLRDKMGFDGIVVSDYIAADRLVDPYRIAETYEEAGVQALGAGLDVEYPRPKCYTYAMEDAIASGKLDIEVLNEAVRRVLTLKFELGLFENPYPVREMLKTEFGRTDTKALNEQIALESITLLKNENNTLPLECKKQRIVVIGPHANLIRSYFSTFTHPAVIDMTTAYQEDGQDFPEPGLIVYNIQQRFPGDLREASPRLEHRLHKAYPESKSLYEAIKEYLPEAHVQWSPGVNYLGNNLSGEQHALELAAQADVVLLTLGGKNGWGVTSTAGEGVDSTDIDLPGRQEEFARKVYALGKKTIVLHFDGRPLSNTFVASHFDAILEVWQPGEYGGQVLCKVLFGEYNPAGRLPVTAARNAGQLPVYYALPRGSGFTGAGHPGMIRNPNGYINDTAYPLYCFGHGLSYTRFQYSALELERSALQPDDTLVATVTLRNIGERAGAEVVQLYASDTVSSVIRPCQELLGFCRVYMEPGEEKQVRFAVPVTQLAFLDQDMQWRVEAGKYSLYSASSSDDHRLKAVFSVEEDALVNGRTRGFYAIGQEVKRG